MGLIFCRATGAAGALEKPFLIVLRTGNLQ